MQKFNSFFRALIPQRLPRILAPTKVTTVKFTGNSHKWNSLREDVVKRLNSEEYADRTWKSIAAEMGVSTSTLRIRIYGGLTEKPTDSTVQKVAKWLGYTPETLSF